MNKEVCVDLMESKKKNKYLDDNIFRFIYISAMRDAILQLAYEGKKKWLMESDVVDNVKTKIEPLINKVLGDMYVSQEEYDGDFLSITIDICQYINQKANNNQFTFGNAQKFVNIMLKFLYITGYKCNELKDRFRFCHCPMDQQLLYNVWQNRMKLKSDKTLGKREWFLKSWGNEDFDFDINDKKTYPRRYVIFQEAVRCIAENMNSLEYDYYIW